MANDLVKAIVKFGTAIVASGFAAGAAREGKKNACAWQSSRKQFQNSSNKK